MNLPLHQPPINVLHGLFCTACFQLGEFFSVEDVQDTYSNIFKCIFILICFCCVHGSEFTLLISAFRTNKRKVSAYCINRCVDQMTVGE